MKIQIVKTNELQVLVKLARRTFLETYGNFSRFDDLESYFSTAMTKDTIYKEMIKDNVQYCFLSKGNQYVGYLKLVTLDSELKMQRIYLLNEWQGKGYGQLFMDKAIEVARDLNKQAIILDVWSNNSHAIKFYEQNGFEFVQEKEFMIGDELQIDYLYRKNI